MAKRAPKSKPKTPAARRPAGPKGNAIETSRGTVTRDPVHKNAVHTGR